MEPKQRRAREITYQSGWRRKTMGYSSADSSPKPMARFHRLNIAFIWRPAKILRLEMLLVGLWMFPVVTFLGSVWLVYRLLAK